MVSFIPNYLNNFAQVAYHIRLYADGDGQSGSNPITIVESGVTGLSIRDFEFTAIAAPSPKVRTTVATRINLTVVEPVGVGFLDAMYSAAVVSGCTNWSKTTYKLEISFKGYDEAGSIVDTINSGYYPNGGKWLWNIIFTTIDTHLDASGGVYKLNGILLSEASSSSLGSNYTITKKTVQETLDELANRMSGVTSNQLGTAPKDSGGKPFDFKIHALDDGTDPGSWEIKGKEGSKDQHPINNDGMTKADRDTQGIHLLNGQTIADAVTSIMTSTEEGQKRAKDSKGTIQNSDDMGTGQYREALLFRTIPVVDANATYDYVHNSYKRNTVFHIVPYRAQDTYLLGTEATNPSNGTEAISRLQEYDGMKKIYEYIYTGLNTEVMNFDINFNMAFTATLPRNSGDNNFAEQVETGPRVKTESNSSTKTAQDGLSSAASAFSDAQEQVTKITNALNASKASEASSDTFRTTSALQGQLTSAQTTLQSTGESLHSEQSAATAAFIASARKSNSGVLYAEDLVSAGGSSLVSVGQTSSEGPRLQNSIGVIGQIHKGKSIYGAILNQTIASNALNEISMTIKGDPWWLPLDWTDQITQPRNQVVTFIEGDITFVVKFKYPTGVNDDGSPILSDSEVMNGIYRATEVTNRFNNGQFTQVIKGVRIKVVRPDMVKNFSAKQGS